MSNLSSLSKWKRLFLVLVVVLCSISTAHAVASEPKAAESPTTLPQQKDQAQAQQPAAQRTTSTQEAVYSLPPEKLAKAIHLSRLRNILHFASALWSIAFLWILLRGHLSANIADWASRQSKHYWLQGVLYLPLLLTALNVADLPIEIYQHHLSLSYGLSVQSWNSWFGDWGKSFALMLLLGTPVLMLFMLIVRIAPKLYWLLFWGTSIPLSVLLVFAVPVLIEPMFNHFEPLSKSNPELVQQLERVVARTGTDIPPERMFLMKASEKSTGLNAYVTGLGKTKRVVVWDTTIQKLPTDDILLIFGHESGHYVMHHIWIGIVFFEGFLFFLFLVGSSCARLLLARCGKSWRLEALTQWAAIPLFLFVVTTLSFVAEPALNGFSRMQEHNADVYGQEAVHGIIPNPQQTAVHSFQALGEAYLDDPNPSPWIEFWTYDHPSVKSRVAFSANYDPWQPGKTPKYFKK